MLRFCAMFLVAALALALGACGMHERVVIENRAQDAVRIEAYPGVPRGYLQGSATPYIYAATLAPGATWDSVRDRAATRREVVLPLPTGPWYVVVDGGSARESVIQLNRANRYAHHVVLGRDAAGQLTFTNILRNGNREPPSLVDREYWENRVLTGDMVGRGR